MGYFDTVRNAKRGEQAMAALEAKQKGLEEADNILAKQDALEARKAAEQEALRNAALQGLKAGSAIASQVVGSPATPAPVNINAPVSGGLGGNQMGESVLMAKAAQVVDQLDAAQEQGAPTSELAKVFESLDPTLKAAVQKVKMSKVQNKQDELNAINQIASLQENNMPRQAPQSPKYRAQPTAITNQAQQIVAETNQMMQPQGQQQ